MKNLLKFSFKQLSTKLFKKPIYILNKFNSKKYFCDKPIEETLESQFENLVENNDNDIEKRIKLVSVKLLSINKSSEAINFFEEKYIKGIISDIQSEELILLIYFYTSLIERESLDSGNRLNIIDKRFDKFIKMIEDKITELDITNLLALCWSVSVLTNKFMYKISPEFETKLINTLPDELPLEKIGDIPTLCFSISTLGKYEAEHEKIRIKVLRYSHQFCKIFLT